MQMQTARSLLQVPEIQSGSAYRTGLLAALLNAVWSVARAIVRRQRQRREILELEQMDDRLLADIGITRGEAEHMVRHGRWGQAAYEPDVAFRTSDRKRSSALIWDKERGKRA